MSRRIQTTETSFEIIDLLKELDGATMPEISDRLGLANSTVHGHLKTLEANQLLVKEGNEYHLGLQFFHYGNFTKQRKPEYQFAADNVERLANDTNEGANFCVEEHGQVIVLNGASTAYDPAYDTGNVFDMHTTAVGKALLAEMTDEAVSEVIDEWGLPAQTDQTITDEDELFDELEEIRHTGLAFNQEEMLNGLSAVGVAVKRPDSSVLGALSVGGPTYRIAGEKLHEEFPEIILDVKRQFEADIRSFYGPK
ncbi:IclR family transcriptional regulator [Halomarina halobia]|uniref:IclR family transcriptional regulator n=1 Tax=Halomarina halobia TaxID=3033386 RepID=A0ABD6AED6_9EURY|nr:IclR family transcriptional regulator [Halomarina sp. PSR21]